MTVQELIDALTAVEDKTINVIVVDPATGDTYEAIDSIDIEDNGDDADVLEITVSE